MFGRTPKIETLRLDAVIGRILDEMDTKGPDSPEYAILLRHCERVDALRKGKEKRSVSPDAVVTAVANILGILIIVSYERLHVVTSKATSLVFKR